MDRSHTEPDDGSGRPGKIGNDRNRTSSTSMFDRGGCNNSAGAPHLLNNGGSMAPMRVGQVARPGGPFEIVERQIPEPSAGSIRIRVQACGICHSDSLTKEGHYPGLQYPRVPGHEVAGVIDAVGPVTVGWQPGQRVGVGWNGGYCGHCDSCRRGEFFACVTHQVTGITYDGVYGKYMIAPASAVALMQAELPAIDAAPLMCAGLTTFNALRNAGARPGDT